MRKAYRCFCLWILLATIPVAAAAGDSSLAIPSNCDRSLGFYADSHYRVGQIVVGSPFPYLSSLQTVMQQAAAASGPKPGTEYASAQVTAGQHEIRARLNEEAARLQLPVTVNVVTAEIRDCRADTNPPSLNVAYYAFVSWFPFSPIATFESRAAAAGDPARAAHVEPKFELMPQLLYNHSLRTSGGARTSLKTPLGKFAIDAIASPSGEILETTHSAPFDWRNGPMRSAEWRTAYLYSDVPADPVRLKQSRLTSQFVGNSTPFGRPGFVFRYGASVGGGHDQAGIPPQSLPPGTLSNNPAGEVKAYAGLSLDGSRQSFEVSYGLKFGQAQTGVHLDFVKQLADAAYAVRIPTHNPHKPVELEAHATGGWVDNLNGIPYVERFFGGNYDYNFLLGDTWRIRSEPFIRSFPQNTLNRLSPDAAVGGTQFFSSNLTVAATVWQRSLVPAAVTGSPGFSQAVDAALNSAQKEMVAYWRSKDAAGAEAMQTIPEAASALTQAITALKDIRGSVPDTLSESYDDCSLTVIVDQGYLDALAPKTGKPFERLSVLESLSAKDEDGSLLALTSCLTTFRTQIGAGFADSIISRLTSVHSAIQQSLTNIDVAQATGKASKDMAFVRRTVAGLLYEMNLASVSPVLTFDAARIGPQTSGAGGGFRYGIGGGARLTFLDTLQLTAGYSVNPTPKPWEGRGAAFFGVEVLRSFH
jgi:hypothetical protein